jgi:hypothetical protein
VFISYAHKDAAWFEKLKTQLSAMELITDKIDIWYDERIPKGAEWEKEIMAALDSAEVGILLISKDFFASGFIKDKELPRLLKAASEERTRLLILIINHCAFSEIPTLNIYQTINPPEKPLSELDDNEQDKYFVELIDEVTNILKTSQ